MSKRAKKVNSPRISIVIPSYNKAKYIGETLKSIVNQNYDNFEVIVQDGGSSDNSVEIIKKYAAKYPDVIKWKSKKDKGQVDAINKGLKKATGDLLAYINADDVYEIGAFSEVAKAYKDYPDALWFAGKGRVIDKNGREITKAVTTYKNILLSINLYTLLLVTNYLMQPSVFLSRKAFDRYGPFTGTKSFVMEYGIWLKIGKIEMPARINRYISKFRLSGDNISSTQFNELMKEDYKLTKRFTNDPIILAIHKIHNLGRVGTVRLLG